MARKPHISRNLSAFLDTIAWSELGTALLKKSDDGYNVIVGSTPAKPDLFTNYGRHPGKYVDLPKYKVQSSAAGRYQILEKYAKHYIKDLNLPDFGPVSQDCIAIQLIKECKALGLIETGRVEDAIKACASRWASFPMAGYGQKEHTMEDLVAHYIACGGVTGHA